MYSVKKQTMEILYICVYIIDLREKNTRLDQESSPGHQFYALSL